MIRGKVTANREAIVHLTMVDANAENQIIEATIDTGFNGFLTLSPELVQKLGFPRLGRGRVILADGSDGIFEIYKASIVWNGEIKHIETDVLDAKPLVGMALLEGFLLQIKIVTDGEVTITPLS